jgi:hypothetical protein
VEKVTWLRGKGEERKADVDKSEKVGVEKVRWLKGKVA